MKIKLVFCSLVGFLPLVASAQEDQIPLWPKGAPGSESRRKNLVPTPGRLAERQLYS